MLRHIDCTDFQTSKTGSHWLHPSICNWGRGGGEGGGETMNSYNLESKTVPSVGGVAEKGVTADESHLESFLKDTEALHL